MHKIAVDLGYGFLKGMNEDGDRILFPSVVGPAHNRDLGELFGTNAKNKLENLQVHVKGDEINGNYFVGSLARESTTKSVAFGTNKIWHPNTMVLLSTAAALLAPDREDIFIVTGLPLDHYKIQRRELSNYLQNFNAEIQFNGNGNPNKTREIKFSRSAVFPQGAGAVYRALQEHPETRHNIGATAAIIDIGFRTTDFITVRIGTPLETLERYSGTIEAGMFHLHRSFETRFLKETGCQVDPARVGEYITAGGKFYFDGREHDFSHTLQTARNELVSVIRDGLIASWRDSFREFRSVFLVGGGASELSDGLEQYFPMLQRISDPQFANCAGFLYYAGLLERRALFRK